MRHSFIYSTKRDTKHPGNIKILKALTARKVPMQVCLHALHNLSTLEEKDSSSNYQNYKEIELTCEEHISIRTYPIIRAKSLMTKTTITKTTISNFKL